MRETELLHRVKTKDSFLELTKELNGSRKGHTKWELRYKLWQFLFDKGLEQSLRRKGL